jgi:hypothetical protein
MDTPLLTVRLIRCFEGPRHERLYKIWDAIAEYIAPEANVRWYANPDVALRHAQCFDRMWQEELEFDNRYVLFTEADFLPDLAVGLENWTGTTLLKDAAVGTLYCTRSEKSWKAMQHRDRCGGWFLLMDKERIPREISFEGEPDPCNQMRSYLRRYGHTIVLRNGYDPYPVHWGMEYPFGTHLFWSRHYNDNPGRRISGFPLRNILGKVDKRISQWIVEQPEDFQALLVERFGSGILGSCCEYTELRAGYRKFFNSLTDSPEVSPASPS